MKRKNILIFLRLALFFLLSACGAAPEEAPSAGEPAEDAAPEASLTQSLPLPTQAATAVPSIPEQRRLTLEFPPKIRAGDSDIVIIN